MPAKVGKRNQQRIFNCDGQFTTEDVIVSYIQENPDSQIFDVINKQNQNTMNRNFTPPSRLIKKIAKSILNLINKRKYYYFSNSARVKKGVEVIGAKYISLGSNVSVMNNSYLQVVGANSDHSPILTIKDGTLIGRNSQICALNKITIGKNCIFAANCFISDTTHTYDDIDVPVISSPLKELSSVEIGDGSWLGRNSSVVGCKIGKHCVIGNCCFVTKDIPDYCVAVGSPARIIKRYNFATKQWEKTDKDGNFILKDN